jgi:hypothetical protein
MIQLIPKDRRASLDSGVRLHHEGLRHPKPLVLRHPSPEEDQSHRDHQALAPQFEDARSHWTGLRHFVQTFVEI